MKNLKLKVASIVIFVKITGCTVTPVDPEIYTLFSEDGERVYEVVRTGVSRAGGPTSQSVHPYRRVGNQLEPIPGHSVVGGPNSQQESTNSAIGTLGGIVDGVTRVYGARQHRKGVTEVARVKGEALRYVADRDLEARANAAPGLILINDNSPNQISYAEGGQGGIGLGGQGGVGLGGNATATSAAVTNTNTEVSAGVTGTIASGCQGPVCMD